MDLLGHPRLAVSVNTIGSVAAENVVTGQGEWSLQQNRELQLLRIQKQALNLSVDIHSGNLVKIIKLSAVGFISWLAL